MASPDGCYVYIHLPGESGMVTCGRFEQFVGTVGSPVGRFAYGRRYLERADAVELDPFHLPLARGTHETAKLGGIFGAIRDASPDYWGRLVIERGLKRAQLSEVEYLLNGPQDGAGALAFGLGKSPPPPVRAFNRIIHLRELLEVAQAIDESPGAHGLPELMTPQLTELIDPRTSMGGARPKNVVVDDEHQWIAKFPQRNDAWNAAAVESGLLSLAALCGIRVAPHRTEKIGAASVLLVERFDRTATGDPEAPFYRHRMVSALTVLDAEDAVTDRARWSYLLFADELSRWVARPARDLQELFRRAVFNCLITNADDHPRNHALIAPGREWQLAPAYDLTPSPTYGQTERFSAMTLGELGRIATRQNLLSEAPRFGYRVDEANAVVDEIVGIVAREWESALRRAGATEADVEAVQPAFLNPGFEYTPTT